MADDGEILTVERAYDGQRVVLAVGTLDVAHLVGLLYECQSELVGQLAYGIDGHHLIYILGLATHDVLGIFAPRRLIGTHLVGRHVDLQSAVLVERAGTKLGRHVA